MHLRFKNNYSTWRSSEQCWAVLTFCENCLVLIFLKTCWELSWVSIKKINSKLVGFKHVDFHKCNNNQFSYLILTTQLLNFHAFFFFFFYVLQVKGRDTLKLKVHKKLMKMPKKMLYDLHFCLKLKKDGHFERKQIKFNIFKCST
jgi:hypothetical protein